MSTSSPAKLEELRARVAARPTDTLARYVLAKELFDRGLHDESAAEFRTLVGAKADWMKAWIHLGQSLLALGRREEARTALEEALHLARVQHHQGPEAEVAALLADL